jgi:lysyl-tRNA synthetase class 1
MFWADEFADQIIKSGKYKPYHVDDMKTPSGRIHVGALRGVVVHDLIHRALLDRKAKSVYTYVFNDMDPMDAFPHYLPESFRQYMGWPLYKIPSPEPGFKSLAQCYAHEFETVFNSLGVKPEIIWSHEEYAAGKFDQTIKTALDKVALVRQLYHDVSGYDKPKDWYPYQVFCPKCGKVGTTIVTGWDGRKVHFTCQKDLVKWAEGCSYEGEIEPVKENGKLMWKVDWAAHWQVIGITAEGAGKDHMSQGGSHDLSSAICEKVLDYPTPFGFIYEWFLAKGGTKMSSSKGVGISAADVSQTIPPELLKFLLVKTPYRRAIIFDPSNNASILDLFDDYDRCAEIYFAKGIADPLGRAWQLSQVGTVPKKPINFPRFRDVVNYLQNPKVDLKIQFSKADKKELTKRIKYAKIWLKNYAPDTHKVGIITKTQTTYAKANITNPPPVLTDKQKQFLRLTNKLLDKIWTRPEDLQQELYQTAKNNQINPKEAFQAIYLSLTGKPYGPQAAWFLLDNNHGLVAEKFDQAIQFVKREEKIVYKYPLISQPEIISISKDMATAYPSIQVAMAVIKGVDNSSDNPAFIKFRDSVVAEVENISLDEISSSEKIRSYRRAIRESGIDWHKRRPTMEALLRRLAQGKNIDWINPLVDIANLMAIKHQMSEGIFDLTNVSLPAVMKRSEGGEQVLMIGDKEPITLQKGEICYFDKIGPFIVDLCWRDSKRTSATPTTKDFLFLSEAVYDISRKDLEVMLDDSINTVIKYLGGKLETAGIITSK